jgi:hypothetical protein
MMRLAFAVNRDSQTEHVSRMDAETAFLIVVPAILLLLAAGSMASAIERIAYSWAIGAESLTDEHLVNAKVEREHAQKRTEFARLRDTKASLDSEIAIARKERANLQGQERRLADRQENLVSEAGIPAPGSKGFYIRLEGPAAMMPFAGLSSVATAFGGRRHVRMVVWAVGPAEAQALATNWAGTDGKLIFIRPFTGTLFWHEA